MTYFDELDDYLSTQFSDDVWSDHAIEYATELVRKLTLPDWTTLTEVWSVRSFQWQQRCAQILPWGDLNHAVPLLLAMVQSSSHDLVVAASDSLRDIHCNVKPLHVPVDIQEHLQTIARNRSDFSTLSVKLLLESL